MKDTLKNGRWYRLTLQIGKTYDAQYIIEYKEQKTEYFVFSDQSRTRADDLVPFLSEIEEIEKPKGEVHYDITDFLL